MVTVNVNGNPREVHPGDLLYVLPFVERLRAEGIPEPAGEYRFLAGRAFRFDLAWPNLRLAVEIEGGLYIEGGGRHNRARGYENDLVKYNVAALLGWRVLRFGPHLLADNSAVAAVKLAYMAASGAPASPQEFSVLAWVNQYHPPATLRAAQRSKRHRETGAPRGQR